MAFTTATHRPAATAGFFGGFVEFIREFAAQRRAYTRTVQELSALSDRELADIGITRGEIHVTAARAALLD